MLSEVFYFRFMMPTHLASIVLMLALTTHSYYYFSHGKTRSYHDISSQHSLCSLRSGRRTKPDADLSCRDSRTGPKLAYTFMVASDPLHSHFTLSFNHCTFTVHSFQLHNIFTHFAKIFIFTLFSQYFAWFLTIIHIFCMLVLKTHFKSFSTLII